MGIRNSWWEKEFTKGDPAAQMGGGDGREGVPHPTHTWFTEYVPEGSSVLDVGCCNGHTLESFMRAGKNLKYYGVDHLEEMVAYCLSKFPTAGFLQSDAADLQDFQDDGFDYVLSRHVWEHLNHYSQHLMEMYRVAVKEVVVVGFLEFTGNEFDRLQYGADGLPHWYNQYSKEGVERFIKYNMPTATYEFIDDFKDIGPPVLIIRKEQV